MPDFNPQITHYPNVNATAEPIGHASFLDILELIRTDSKKEKKQTWLRSLTLEEYTDKKKSLDGVTFSGTFKPVEITSGKNKGKQSYRTAEGLIEYTHIVLYDVDKLEPEKLQQFRELLVMNPYVLALFISPSGKGLKILFRESTGNHEAVWMAINGYLRKAYGLPIDESGKDVCRLCFVAYDPELYYNPDCEVIDTMFVKEHTPAPEKPAAAVPKKKAVKSKGPVTDFFAKCHEITQKTTPIPQGGGYNKYTNVYALQANRYGISENDCWAELAAYFPVPNYEDQRPVVSSVYSKFAGEHGAWLRDRADNTQVNSSIEGSPAAGDGKQKKEPKFWFEKITKDQNGNESIEYKISYDDSILFMQYHGFFKYRLENHRYQLIRVDGASNIVDAITELQVKEFMIDYLRSNDSLEFKRVREIFRRGAKNYCSPSILEGLEYYKPHLRRDTATTASLYFKNCYLEVSAGGVVTRQYHELQGMLWQKQVRDIEFHHSEWKGCDVSEFLSRAITGRKLDGPGTEAEQKKLLSVYTTIGYLLHRYKNPSVTKAVIATDMVLRRGKENEGRTGKSLLAKCIKHVVNVTMIEGQNFSFDKPFPFQLVNIDTEVINMNDVRKNFDFTRLFGMVTEEFAFEKKNQDMITVSFEDAPKFYISANTSLRGDGASTRARQQVIEFTNYYTEMHQPTHQDEFGRHFFSGWDPQEWNRFYSFMVHCLQMYLQHGLIDFPLENYGMNKLIDRAGEEFLDFMDEHVLDTLETVFEHKQNELYDAYFKDIDLKYRVKKPEFTSRIQAWAEVSGLVINPHKKPGERDRRNGVTYLRFAKVNPEPDQSAGEVEIKPGDPLPF